MLNQKRNPQAPKFIRQDNEKMWKSPAPKIALVHPPAVSKRYLRTKFMPYGMAVIYAFLREHNIPVTQYDFLMEYLFDSPNDINFHSMDHAFSEEDFFSFLHGTTTHKGLADFTIKYGERITRDACLYGFSIVAYHQFWASLLLAKYVREINPAATIVFGGPFITIRPAESLVAFGQADFWIKGSGELPLYYLYRLSQGDENLSIEKIPGIVFKKGQKIYQAPKSCFPAEEERSPDFEGLSLETYQYDHPVTGAKTLFIPYRMSKGCPSRCSFCTGRLVDSYNCKSPEKVISDLTHLSAKYQSSNFQFADASINGSPRQLSQVCAALKKSLPNIRWYAYAKVNGFDKQLLLQVKDAGCFSLFWGIESASQPTIDLLGKRFTVDRMYELLDYSISIGMTNFVHLMYNTPHESTEDIEALETLIKRYICSSLVIFLPQRFILEPQSLMFENPHEFGLSSLKPIEASPFEREQYIYSEAGGEDFHGVIVRNRQHQEKLSHCFELIRLMDWNRNSHGPLARVVTRKLLVYLGHRGHDGRALGRLFKGILHRMVAASPQSVREQL